MYKKFILLFLVLFILFVYSRFLFKSITGFIAEFLSLSLSIKSATEGEITYFSYPPEIYLMYKYGETILSQNATFDVMFMNTGNLNISGRIVVYVKNSTLHTFGTYYDDYFNLSPLATRNFSATYLPNVTGRYWVIVNVTYNSSTEEKFTEENATFDVLYGLNIRVTVTANSNAFCPNDTVNVTTKLENIGYFNVTGDLNSRILNQYSNVKKEENWHEINLSTNEIQYYYINYTVKDSDGISNYGASSDFTYYSHSNSSSTGFRINNGEGILLVSPYTIEKTIYAGESTTQNLHMWISYACVNTVARVNTSTGHPGDWVNFSKDELFLGSNGYLNTTVLNISVPSGTEKGLYIGTIYVNTVKQEKEIPLTVHVGTYSISSSVEFLPPPPTTICLNDNLTANVTILSGYLGTINLKVTYRLSDPLSRLVTEWNETLDVDGSVQKNVTFTIPSNGIEGYYTFTVIAQYDSLVDQSSLTFNVISCVTPTTIPAGPGGGGGGLVEIPVAPVFKPVHNLTLSLSKNILTVLLGNETSFFAYVKNTGTKDVDSVRISVERIPSDWIRVSPSYSDIHVNETQAYLVVISVPRNASVRAYKLGVKATDKVESNTETLTLIIGKDSKEVVDMLLKELQNIRARAKKSLSIDCVNIISLKILQEDAELAFDNGMKEYGNNNYEKVINWFEYAIALEEKIINSADVTMKIEIESLSLSRILFPTSLEFNKQLLLAKNYLDAKEHKIICVTIIKMRNLIKAAVLFWILIILLIVLILLLIILKRRKKKKIEELTIPKLRLETVK